MRRRLALHGVRPSKLTDLTTGKSLNVHVQSTGNHIDAEPLTSADTTTLCEIYGVSSPNSISYKRRPMMITTSAGQFLCSIYGQPHGAQDITNNGYDGQFCLHFVEFQNAWHEPCGYGSSERHQQR